MSLFRREVRDISMGDWIRGLDTGGSRTKSGVTVTPANATRLSALWSSVHLLASVVSNLPVDVFRGSGVSKQEVLPQPALVAAPSLVVSRREWVYQAMTSLLLRGNAYGYVVERDGALRPRTVEWLNPDAVKVSQESSLDKPTYELGGVELERADVLHLRAFVQAGSAVGLSPIEHHAEMLGVGLAAQRFGAEWFGGGAHPSAIFRNSEKTYTPDQAKDIKERFLASIRRREPITVGKDWSYEQVQVAANESQFLETMGYTDAQVARLYGPGLAEILGYGTSGSTLTYSNRVDRSLDLLTYAVMPWVNKFDDMWTANIAQPETARMNVAALLRADPKAQREMFRVDREIGLHNIDEIRALLDEPPLPDGQGEDYAPLPRGRREAE